MYNGLNSVPLVDGRPRGPIHMKSPASAIYFIAYMVIITFILLQLFVGFVIITFQEIGVKSFRETKLDRNQVSGSLF